MVVRFALICFLFLYCKQANAQELECYPSDFETLMLEYVNLIRAKPSKDTMLKNFKLDKCEELKKIPPFNQEIFQQELDKLESIGPVFYDPFLSVASRNHSRYMIVNGQSHEEVEGKPFFTGRRFTDRLKSINCPLPGFGENCYLKSYGPNHSMLAFLIDWGEGLGGMQTDRPHRQNLFNKKAILVGHGCIPFEKDYLAVTQIYSAGEANTDYFGGVIYTDYNKNGFYDVGEGHGNFQIKGNDDELSTESYPSGLFVFKANKGQIKTIKFQYSSFFKVENINQLGGSQKIDLKLTQEEENQILINLQKNWQEKKITDSDFAWLCLGFNFKNYTEESKMNLPEIAELKVIKAAILNELASGSVDQLNQMISQVYQNKKGEVLQEWLKSLSYLANMRSQFFALKNKESPNVSSWQELKSKIDTGRYPANEANYYLKKLIHHIDFEILTLKEKK